MDGGRIAAVEQVADPAPGDVRLPGLVLPGFANAHSHAFHRALRGRTHDRGGTFWTWRERMYAVAARLDPDSYLALARATYAEMALAGVTCVGEFHYLHHPAGGGRYADPNAMVGGAGPGRRRRRHPAHPARRLLPRGRPRRHAATSPLDDVQTRFSDGDADAWAARVALLPERARAPDRRGRALGAGGPGRAAVRASRGRPGRPLHVHLSEQPAENEACAAFYGRTPTRLLADRGLLGPDTTAVHATHLTADDVTDLGGSGTAVCACPSTEADLADGVGPFRRLRDAGSPLCLGSDQHALTDLLAEARLLEADERLATGERGRFRPGRAGRRP